MFGMYVLHSSSEQYASYANPSDTLLLKGTHRLGGLGNWTQVFQVQVTFAGGVGGGWIDLRTARRPAGPLLPVQPVSTACLSEGPCRKPLPTSLAKEWGARRCAGASSARASALLQHLREGPPGSNQPLALEVLKLV